MYEDLSLQEYLKTLRKSLGYSQEFVASHLNITRQTYSHYETGRIMPPVNSIYNIARLYGMPVETFLEKEVTYRIYEDFDKSPRASVRDGIDNVHEYNKKCANLSHAERELLYYFSMLDDRDRSDIIAFMKIKKDRVKQ